MLGYKEISCQNMSVADMCMFCWMCGNTKRDKVRNEDILIKIGVTPIKEKMRENCLRWFDHVQRRPTIRQFGE